MPKVFFSIPSMAGMTKHTASALAASLPLIEAAGFECGMVQEIGSPYISAARATMLAKAMQNGADHVVFIDYDLSWDAEDLLTLIVTPGDVTAGTYRFKKPDEEYMGGWFVDADNRPVLRDDGCFKASRVPAGFLHVTRKGIENFMGAYPDLLYGDDDNRHVDLFNHGVIDGVWYGEDYAFSKRWIERCGNIWLIPDLNIAHHSATADFPGNLHEFMMRQPGGINDPARIAA